MRKPLIVTALACLWLASAALAQPPAQVQGPPPGAPGRGPPAPLPAATTPTPPRTQTRHQEFLKVAQAGNIDVLFVGDSITDWWRQPQRGLPVFETTFAPLKTANFGIAGDTTQGVLWRMQNGELDGFKAKVIVFMLGTNNINRNDNADIAAGDAAIIAEFRKRQPQAKVLVLGIFPRGAAPDNAYRAKIREINGLLAKQADGRQVHYLDIGDQFLTADGTLTTEVFPDGLHPNLKGYGIWAEAMAPKVKELLG